MRFGSILASAAALTLTVATTGAQAAPLPARSSPIAEDEQLAGGLPLWVILLIIASGVGLFLILDDDDSPESP